MFSHSINTLAVIRAAVAVSARNMNNYTSLCLGIFFLFVSAESFLLHTNIGKFLHNINLKIQNHSLASPANLKVDRSILESAFEGFRNIIDDPLRINEQTLNYEMIDVIKTRGYMKNLQIEHLKNMTLDHLYISEDNLYTEFVIRIPRLEISGLYNSTCYLKQYDFDIYGNGSFKWLIVDFKIKANFTLKKMNTEYMQLDKINLDQSINSSKFEIKNLLNDEDVSTVVSEVLTVVIPPLHNYFKPVINEFINRLMLLYSEIVFSKLNTKDFVGVIHEFKEKSNINNFVSS